MHSFKTVLLQFGNNGEKTGWTYMEIPPAITTALNPSDKRSFRVKGKIDNMALSQAALLPMGEGGYILPVNATMRRQLKKKAGDVVEVLMDVDRSELFISADLVTCLEQDPIACAQFTALPLSHRKYFSNWVESAKTITTKADRIAKALFAMQSGMNYPEMIRHFKTKA